MTGWSTSSIPDGRLDGDGDGRSWRAMPRSSGARPGRRRGDAGGLCRLAGALKAAGRQVKMLWQHDPAQPIGVWDEVREDARGLWVKGRLLTEVARGREAAALIAAGAIDGLSIGYRTLRPSATGGRAAAAGRAGALGGVARDLSDAARGAGRGQGEDPAEAAAPAGTGRRRFEAARARLAVAERVRGPRALHEDDDMSETEAKTAGGQDLPAAADPAAEVKAALTGFLNEFGLSRRDQDQAATTGRATDHAGPQTRRLSAATRARRFRPGGEAGPPPQGLCRLSAHGRRRRAARPRLEGKAMNTAVAAEGGYLVDPQTAETIRGAAGHRLDPGIANVVNVEATSFDVLVDHTDWARLGDRDRARRPRRHAADRPHQRSRCTSCRRCPRRQPAAAGRQRLRHRGLAGGRIADRSPGPRRRPSSTATAWTSRAAS
jgi:uncharacterized protein